MEWFEICFFLFFVIFALSFVVILFMQVFALRQWSKDKHSPRLTVPATVVSKRMQMSHHSTNGMNGSMGGCYNTTSYFVTFQVESGDRMELHLSGPEYGLLIEGDRGHLTFQGRRFLNFQQN